MEFAIVSKVLETLSALGFFTAVFLSIYFYLKFRNRERTMLIEKNVDISEFYKKKESRKTPWYIIGFVFLGISLGFIFTLIITFQFPKSDPTIFLISGGLFFGSIGILVGYKLEQKEKLNG